MTLLRKIFLATLPALTFILGVAFTKLDPLYALTHESGRAMVAMLLVAGVGGVVIWFMPIKRRKR